MKKVKHYIYNLISNYLDIVLAISGLVSLVLLSILLLVLGFGHIYIIALLVGVVCIVIYILFRNKISVADTNSDMKVWAISLICAVIFIVLALLFYTENMGYYTKPLLYYVFTAISVSFIFISALNVSDKWCVIMTLSVICTVGLMHLWTECMLFSGVVGMDAWVHQRITTEEIPAALGIGNNPYNLVPLWIKTLGGYYSLMHVYIYNLMSIFSLDYKMTVLIFWSSLQVVGNIIFTYLVGNELYNRKVGIGAALMITIANWVLFFNEWAIPNTLGFTLSLIVSYLLIRLYKTNRYWLVIPVVLVAIISFMTHIIVSVWVMGVVACMSIVPQILTKCRTIVIQIKQILKSCILPVFIVVLFLVWFNFTYMHFALGNSTTNGQYTPTSGLTYALGKAPIVQTVEPTAINRIVITTDNVSSVEESIINTISDNVNNQYGLFTNQLTNDQLGETVANSLGMFLYIGLAIIGGLAMIKGKLAPLKATWVILCFTVLLIGFVPPIFGMSLIEHRWWGLAQIFMTIPLAVILIGLSNMTKRWYGIAIVAVLVGIMAFMSTIGLPSNISNRDLSKNQIVRYGFTDKELEGLTVAKQYNPERLGADSWYLCYIQSHGEWCYSHDMVSVTLDKNILFGDFSNCVSDVIILRDALYKEPFAYGSGVIYKLNYNPIELAKTQGYKEVYDNREIHCLIRE